MSKGKLFLFFVFIAALIAAISMPTTSSNSNGNQTQSYGLIVGRNVNMVSGTEAPNGDPYLQRQNEPSGAVSTRNPMHILAGANDYRTIDIPFQDKLPGKEEYLAQIRDAWVGVFKSFNGAQSWISTLLPGYPQDTSPEGTSSPLHGYDFACDPTVRAGANGLFYYSGIAAERGDQGRGVVFVARYIDSNNSEFLDTIEYVDTKIPDYGTKGLFLDMPHTAVDVPRGGGTVTIKGQEIPRSNVYITYTRFLGKSGRNVQDQVMFARSTDCGETWSNPIILSQSRLILQRPTIAIDPSDPTGKTIYVAFRQFMHPAHTTAITIVKSTDWGQTFTLPIHVTSFIPFDQVSSTRSFRTTSYPSLAVDADGIVYLAWTQRNEPEGPARIVIATSADGINWPSNQMKDVENYHATEEVKGHQFMPSLTYAGDKLMLGWYDQRHDIAQNPVILSDGAFTPYIEDWDCRHTIDVRVAYGEPGLDPIFSPSRQVSRYLYTLYIDEYGEPIEENGYWKIDQAEFNAINYPLFQQGTTPFHGDWMEAVPSPWIFLPPNGQWSFNTELSQPTTSLMIWTDNRDVNPPGGSWWGDWTDYFEWPLYSAPDSEQEPGWEPPACEYELNTGMRNQNIYTANVSDGLIVGSPQNTKQLDPDIQRTFVVYAKNTTELDRYFEFRIDEIGDATASFEQDLLTPNVHELKVAITPLSSASVTVYVDPYTGGNSTTIMVEVVEIDEDGDVMPGGLYGYVLLNPDATNPDVIDHSDPNNPVNLGDEHHNPRVQGPRVWGYDLGNASEMNPRVQGPRVQGYGHINTGFINPRVQGEDPLNPRVQGPRVWGPRVQGPRVQGINVLNQDVINPRVQGPRVQGTALTDITYPIVNDGNTTSAYSINLRSLFPEDFDEEKLIAQLLIYKVYTSPVSDGCELKQVHHDELVTNIYNPRVQGPRVQGSAQTSSATSQINGDWKIPEPTIYLEPGQMGYVTVRVWDDDTADSIVFSPDNVTIDMPAQAPDTGQTEPEIGFPPGHGPGQWPDPAPKIWRSPESMSFTAQEGGTDPASQTFQVMNVTEDTTLNYKVTKDAPWLTADPSYGSLDYNESQLHNVSVDVFGLSAGTYTANIVIFDTDYQASNNPQFVRVTLYVVSSEEPTQVKLSGPTWVLLGEISKAFTLVSLDSEGNPANVDGDTDFNLASTSSGEKFYSDPGGSTEITQVTIDSGSSSATFYYRDTVEGDHTITADFHSGPIDLGSASHPISVLIGSMTVAEWVARYDATGDYELVSDLAVDSSGNIYVTGWSTQNGSSLDITTIKYDGSGNQLWDRHYDGPGNLRDEGHAITVDSLGNVYVTGRTENSGTYKDWDYVTLKYDKNGNLLWDERYNGAGDLFDCAYAIAVDSSGNVYVTGRSDGDPSSADNYDFATVKYDSSGNLLWDAQYNGPGDDEEWPRAIAVDSSGCVYVTGWSTGSGTGFDYATVKYDANGNQIWDARYDGGVGDDRAYDMAIDSTGVYVTGFSEGSGTGKDYATIKYDKNTGNTLWNSFPDGVSRYHRGGGDSASAIAVDSAGNVYVTGSSAGPTLFDYVTVKHDASGTIEWDARYDGTGSGSDFANAVTVDPLGNVYVTGSSTGTGTDYDFATLKYDNYGNQSWIARYDGPGLDSDQAEAIALDPTGNVYVTGRSIGSETDQDYATVKYSQSFPSTLIITTETLDTGYSGVPYAATVWAFGGSGSRTWSDDGNLPPGLTLDPSTGVISGTPTSPAIYNFTVSVDDYDYPFLSDNRTFSLEINVPTLYITTEELPPGIADGVTGCGYYPPADPGDPPVKLEATGGNQPYTWSVAEGDFPSGLTLSSIGEISGVPEYDSGATYPKEYVFTVQVTDSTPQSVSKPLSITVDLPPLGIGTTGLPDGVIGQVYDSPALIADCALGTLTWSIVEGEYALPPELGLNPETGVISGMPGIDEVPDYPYTYNFTVEVTDSVGSRTASKPLSITIAKPLEITTPSTLPYGVAGVSYGPVTLNATFGIQPYQWPPGPLGGTGLSIDANGVISGTPTAVGVHQGVLVEAYDSASPAQWASKQFNIVIHSSAPPSGLVSWWSGDNNAFDYVNGNHGTLINGATYAGGLIEYAFYFDRVDDYVYAPGTGIDNLQDLTIEAWVKLNSLTINLGSKAQRFVTLLGEKAVLRLSGFGYSPPNTGLHFYMKIDDGATNELRHIWANDVLRVGCFHHVVGTYDGDIMRLYLDGAEVGNLPVSGTVSLGSGVELSSGGETLNGLLDEVKIYNYALSPTEIQTIYNAGPLGRCEAPGNSHKLAFDYQPTSTSVDSVISPIVSVLILDENNALKRDATDTVTLALQNGTGTLNGTVSRAAVNGIAAFDDLSVDTASTGYTLIATSSGLQEAISQSFDIIPPQTTYPEGIAFTSTRDGNYDIYVMKTDGTGVTRLTISSELDHTPWWSPDGSKIAFVSNRSIERDIWIMNADGTGQTNLTNHPANDNRPSWSPDGNKIAFQRYQDENYEIYVMDADGTNVIRLTDNIFEDSTPSWSPDGSKIAFQSDRDGYYQIYVMNADGTGQLNRSNNSGHDISPRWSPDGNKIVFASQRDGDSDYEIFLMDADGSNQTKLTDNGAQDSRPSWSPGGSKIVFQSNRDNNYEIYIMDADGENETRLTFDPAADMLPNWGFGSRGYEFLTKWGSQGTGDGRFNYPMGIAVDSSGYVYVVDNENYRVQKFTSDGVFAGQWGSQGTGDGQFQFPEDIAVDSSGFVYVTDANNNRVQKFDSNGGFQGWWGKDDNGDIGWHPPSSGRWGVAGSEEGAFDYPMGIAVDSSGYVYVTEDENSRVQKFTSDGVFAGQWGSPGDGDGQFQFPEGIAVDSSGFVYVTDASNHRVQKFTSNGGFVGWWGKDDNGDIGWHAPLSGRTGVAGSEDGAFNYPMGIAVDSSGFVYVVEDENYRAQKFTSNGVFVTKWGSQGTGDGQFQFPEDIAIDNSGFVYVTDANNNRVQKFK